jgi:catechol 2,3-dioxygenase-like lactoylglutathione lyase family enzyme
MAIVGVDHVQVAAPAGCEPAARDFYGGLLGMREIPKPAALQAGGGVWFACGGDEIHVGVEDPFAPARKAHPGLLADDADALAERLAAAGCEVAWDERIAGVRRFYTADPFGNRLEIRAL